MPATEEPPIGQRLRHLRRMAHLTEAELARCVGVTAKEIVRIEAGASVSFRTVEEIAEACGFGVVITFTPVRDRGARRHSGS